MVEMISLRVVLLKSFYFDFYTLFQIFENLIKMVGRELLRYSNDQQRCDWNAASSFSCNFIVNFGFL